MPTKMPRVTFAISQEELSRVEAFQKEHNIKTSRKPSFMSYLIKWKLEKSLKRRDFGEIMQNSQSKIPDMRETLKRDGASARL